MIKTHAVYSVIKEHNIYFTEIVPCQYISNDNCHGKGQQSTIWKHSNRTCTIEYNTPWGVLQKPCGDPSYKRYRD